MGRFLNVVPVTDAVAVVVRIAPSPVREEIDLNDAAGRVLFSPVTADTDIPGFDRSVVDGYAVIAADTVGAGDAIPAMLNRCTAQPKKQLPGHLFHFHRHREWSW